MKSKIFDWHCASALILGIVAFLSLFYIDAYCSVQEAMASSRTDILKKTLEIIYDTVFSDVFTLILLLLVFSQYLIPLIGVYLLNNYRIIRYFWLATTFTLPFISYSIPSECLRSSGEPVFAFLIHFFVLSSISIATVSYIILSRWLSRP